MGEAQDRRSQIVETARRSFGSSGFDGTSIGDLANELGISKAAVAYYFPAKEDFLGEFIGPLIEALEEAVGEAENGEAALAAYLEVLTAQHDMAVWLDTDPLLQHHSEYSGRLAAVNATVVRLLTGGSRRKADRVRALSALGGVWRPVRELSQSDLESLRSEILKAAMAGSASA